MRKDGKSIVGKLLCVVNSFLGGCGKICLELVRTKISEVKRRDVEEGERLGFEEYLFCVVREFSYVIFNGLLDHIILELGSVRVNHRFISSVDFIIMRFVVEKTESLNTSAETVMVIHNISDFS